MLAVFITMVFFGFSFWELINLPASGQNEAYFKKVAAVVAADFFSRKKPLYAVAVNHADPQRWDHNALEYRYFLEAYYHLPSSNWEEIDYQGAEVLYLIDETQLSAPLDLGGMEMVAFGPKRIGKSWHLKDGRAIYRLVR